MSTTELSTVQSDLLRIIASRKKPECLKALADLRKSLNLSTQAASAKTGKADGVINGWEKRYFPAPRTLFKYLVDLGIDRATLTTLFETSHKAQLLEAANKISLSEALDRILSNPELAHDSHELEKLSFQFGVPRTLCAMILRAADGDVPAANLVYKWWREWEQRDIARRLKPAPVVGSSPSWVEQSLPTVDSHDAAALSAADIADTSTV